MDEFSLISDHSVLLQGRGMFSAGTEASTFSADRYLGLGNSSSGGYTVRTQDERKNKGKDVFDCDWLELGGFDDFETNLRNFDPTFEIGSNYFEDPHIWSSICSPEAQLVPSSYFDNIDFSIDRNESMADHILQSSVSVPDATSAKHSFIHQINMKNPTNTQQQSRNEVRDTPLNCEAHASSSSGEIEQFSHHSDAELFCPLDDIASANQIGGCEELEAILCSNREMRVPTASSTMCNDGTVPSSTFSGPDLVAAHIPRSKKKPHVLFHGTPDMILEGMAENPLDMYFPLLSAYEQPEMLMSDTAAQTYQFPGSDVQNCAGSQFCSKEMTSAELHEQPSSTLILEAVPVKDLGFQKLQEGMNQMDVATKGRIRDALYRLANGVEQKHCVASTSGAVGSSGSKRFKSSRWTETQTNPVDQSVAQLLLQKPLYQKTALPHRVA
ncbi:uncharacterized protein LOC133918101 [Phragmites australis]|uniref:uncharacterized protein LOC133918101 n=1 Tax=Phragmites australis TaxID=29695 RepID=UPI002D77AAF8|nr:uncharacterized protein LOC133918101 [Phragmites australis]